MRARHAARPQSPSPARTVETRSDRHNDVSGTPHPKGLGASDRQRVARIQYASALKVAHDRSPKPLRDRTQVGAGVDRAGADHDHRPIGAPEQHHCLGDSARVYALRFREFRSRVGR